ncbi:excinuclease ABC subunit UvrC [Anaerolentibacter hominis]|uniref:excinuclease ABC subunit UvrC n=1 Tax=Anaerolentibacter hominis TaxID=3079009 RepID=UPI0031B878F7
MNIEEELKKLPAKPGVYIMRDIHDNIIYVGKAISLKNRVRQYFQNSRNHTPKIIQMVSHIDHFEYIITDSEVEALVLECNLIKEHRPKYNTMLKDDKGYPYIRVTLQEEFPRFLMARKHIPKDKSKYFGPYTSAGAVKDSLELIRKVYKIRSCHRILPRDIGKERPCLNYHIKQCLAPCQGYVSKEEYGKNVASALEFLNGNYGPIQKYLMERMQEAAENLEFEAAAELRDLLERVKQIAQKQKINDANNQEDRDIIAFAKNENDAVVQVFFIRGGKLIGRDHFYVTGVKDEQDSEILTAFIQQFYSGTPHIPKELMLQAEPEDGETISEWLSKKRGQKVFLRVPKIGEKEKMVELARKNAELVLSQDVERLKKEKQRTTGAVKELEDLLGLTGIERMESYDISNISGFDSVGSMVVFENGKPKRADYRKFRIKWVKGPDDYSSMREVLTRRFSHGLKEREELKNKQLSGTMGSFTKFPDLILMDGGKGQVNIAVEVLHNLGLTIPVCGMVKDDNHRTRGIYFEGVELPISPSSEGFRLVTRIQDETHRFAIEYHRSLRSKSQVHSVLDDIEGVGPARRKALMRHFQGLADIKAASVEDLAAVAGMNKGVAQKVYDFFH